MNEADVVMEIESGASDKDVCVMFDISFGQLDEIMTAHNYTKVDDEWVFNDG